MPLLGCARIELTMSFVNNTIALLDDFYPVNVVIREIQNSFSCEYFVNNSEA